MDASTQNSFYQTQFYWSHYLLLSFYISCLCFFKDPLPLCLGNWPNSMTAVDLVSCRTSADWLETCHEVYEACLNRGQPMLFSLSVLEPKHPNLTFFFRTKKFLELHFQLNGSVFLVEHIHFIRKWDFSAIPSVIFYPLLLGNASNGVV